MFRDDEPKPASFKFMAVKMNQNDFASISGTDDREARSKFWIAAYTRSRSEKKADIELRAIGIETFLPVQQQIRQWSDRTKKVEVPIIPMVIFAYVREPELSLILSNHLIIKILSMPGEKVPAHIPTEHIERLRFILGQSDVPVEYDPHPFRIDDSVEIVRGYLKGLRGEVHECSDGSTEFIVRIDFLGGAKLKINKLDLIHI